MTCPYEWEKARLVVREMADNLALDLVNKGLVSDQMILTVGYDIENLTDPERRKQYKGEVTIDVYGRKIPKHAHGTIHLDRQTSSAKLITDAVMELFDQIVDKTLLVRRMNLVAGKVALEADVKKTEETYEQLNLFTDYLALQEKQEAEQKSLEKERKMQQAMIDIKKKFGKNAILKGVSLEEGATAMQRNCQIGGHKA